MSSVTAVPSGASEARVTESDPSRASPTSAKRSSLAAPGGDTRAVNDTRSPAAGCCASEGVSDTVHEAASGREALARCARLSPPPALLLTDLVMPAHVDGVALAAQLRARTPGLRVLFTSGYDHAAQCPPNAPFLQKPFSPARLSDAVHAALLAPSTH